MYQAAVLSGIGGTPAAALDLRTPAQATAPDFSEWTDGAGRAWDVLGTGWVYDPGTPNTAPNAVLSANPQSGTAPLTVSFNASTSTDPDGDALTFAWDLDGDGQRDDSTIAAPTFTYTAEGTSSGVGGGVRRTGWERHRHRHHRGQRTDRAGWRAVQRRCRGRHHDPDRALLDIAGDLDIRADVALDDWNDDGARLVSKGNAYELSLNGTTGGLRFAWTRRNGSPSAVTSTVPLPVADGTRIQVRVTFDGVTPPPRLSAVTFWYRTATSTELSSNSGWTQLGSVVTAAQTGQLRSTPLALALGATPDGTSGNWAGEYHAALVLSGIAGTAVASPDFRDLDQLTSTPPDYSRWTDPNANAWTITGSGWGYVAG